MLSGHPGVVGVGGAAPSDDLSSDSLSSNIAIWDWKEADRLPDPDTLPVVAIVPDEAHAGEALLSGARGVLLRDADPERLVAALRAVAEGLRVVDEGLAEATLSRPRPSPLVEDLTPREIEVLQLISDGLVNREIGQRLFLSEETVKSHVRHLLAKLQARSRAHAVAVGFRRGIIA